jgi:hypothetical protein
MQHTFWVARFPKFTAALEQLGHPVRFDPFALTLIIRDRLGQMMTVDAAKISDSFLRIGIKGTAEQMVDEHRKAFGNGKYG